MSESEPGPIRTERMRQARELGTHTFREWKALLRRFDYRCAYCGESKPLTVDHVIPVSKGGSDSIANILPACQRCNLGKRDAVGYPFDLVNGVPRALMLLGVRKTAEMELGLMPEPTDLPKGLSTAERILIARLRSGLEQQEVAAKTGLTRVTISNYERGKTTPQPTAFPLLASALGVPVEWLRNGS